jgi:protoporphyrinogen oxidase
MTTVVIGGGLAGLAAAYDLARAGEQVTILDNAPRFGGLASTVSIEGLPIERFYHFICRGDSDLLRLVDELGITHLLHWSPSQTQFFYNGQMYQFSRPYHLLTFRPVPFIQRIRFGLHVLASRFRKDWSELDGIPARAWLVDHVGQQAYYVIWHPLLGVKFGDYHDKISAAWIWHRINRVATSRKGFIGQDYLGYLEYGTDTVTDALVEFLKAHENITLRPGVGVEEILIENNRAEGVRLKGGEIIPADQVVSTVALPILSQMAPNLDPTFKAKIDKVEYIGVVCMLLHLDRPLSNAFWTNINDPEISFNGFIEYSQLNKHVRDQGVHIVYIPYYLRPDDPRYQFDDQYLYEEYCGMLKLIRPDFEDSWVKSYQVFRARYAQAICHTHFTELIPEHETPTQGLYVTDSTQFYPEDRTISAAIRMGRIVARLINQKRSAAKVRHMEKVMLP